MSSSPARSGRLGRQVRSNHPARVSDAGSFPQSPLHRSRESGALSQQEPLCCPSGGSGGGSRLLPGEQQQTSTHAKLLERRENRAAAAAQVSARFIHWGTGTLNDVNDRSLEDLF